MTEGFTDFYCAAHLSRPGALMQIKISLLSALVDTFAAHNTSLPPLKQRKGAFVLTSRAASPRHNARLCRPLLSRTHLPSPPHLRDLSLSLALSLALLPPPPPVATSRGFELVPSYSLQPLICTGPRERFDTAVPRALHLGILLSASMTRRGFLSSVNTGENRNAWLIVVTTLWLCLPVRVRLS